jgi:hypothetical protein
VRFIRDRGVSRPLEPGQKLLAVLRQRRVPEVDQAASRSHPLLVAFVSVGPKGWLVLRQDMRDLLPVVEVPNDCRRQMP